MATYLTVILLTLAILGLALSHLLGEYFFSIRERRLLSRGREIVKLAREELADGRQKVPESLLEQIDASLQARIWIVDRQGIIVASSEARKTHWMGVRLDPEEISSVLAGQILVQRGTTRRYGIPMITVGLPVRSNGRVVGAVIMNSPVAMVRSSIRQVEMLVLYAALVAVLLSALFGLVISRSISLPLRKMGRTALKMAEGDYRQKIEVASEDEVGQLGQALNHLAVSLDQTVSALYKQEKVRRDFVANVSHELRTPLTSIRGFVEPLIDGTVQDPQTKDRYLRIIREETERLKRLTAEGFEGYPLRKDFKLPAPAPPATGRGCGRRAWR
ncbi:MAG: HAMP domain-containing protein [Firmicutes bacterium]|nr:HAMP domain-containing protein [Bacillota bacterium]